MKDLPCGVILIWIRIFWEFSLNFDVHLNLRLRIHAVILAVDSRNILVSFR